MAPFQIGPVSTTVGLARSTLTRRPPTTSTCASCRHLSYTAASPRAQHARRVPGRRPFSQQSRRPGAESKVHRSGIRWHPIPVGLGVGFLGLVQFYKVYTREQEKETENGEPGQRPKRRPRVRPDGPWYGAC